MASFDCLQDGIQKVLLSLSKALSTRHMIASKLRVLDMYELFVTLLLAEFHQQLGGSWAFVLRDVIHTLLRNVSAIFSGVNSA